MCRTAWLVLILCGAPLGSPAAALRAQGSAGEKRLEERVRKALAENGTDVSAVQVRVRGRVVFLSGEVKTALEKLRAVEAAFSVPEVEEVESGLAVRSGGTPEIEEQIWMALRQEGLDAFVSEVLVKDGVASVRGEVPDPATRDRVLAVATGTPGVGSVGNDLSLPAPAPVEAPAELEPARVEPSAEPEPLEPPPPAPMEPARELPGTTPELPQQIVYQILTYRGYTVFDQVQFAIEGTGVTLSGAVTELSKKQEIEDRVRSVPGIGKLESEIRVLPKSKTDDKLRRELFRRIYEDSMFARFADDPNPPIHIIVENGFVTLSGIVDELIDQMSAEAMVRNAFGVAEVRNQLRLRR